MRNLRFISLAVIIILLIGAVSVVAASNNNNPTATTEPAAAVVAEQQADVVSAEAFVVPLQESELAFEVGGRVAVIEVEEGEKVAQGQVLARLDQTSFQTQVAQAQAGLRQAQANLAKAEADLVNIKAPATPEDLAQAQAGLDKAQAALAELVAGATDEDIAVAQAGVAEAQANLNKVAAKTRDEDLQAASAQMLQTEAEVRLAQANYDKFVYGDPKVAEPYGVALQKATLTYNAAKAQYDKLVNGATAEDIAIARAAVTRAQAVLAQTQAGATAEQIAQGQAGVASAQAALEDLKAGATAEQIAVAEAGVNIAQAGLESAQAGVAQAQAELAKTELLAPFTGLVGLVNVEEGEIVQAGTAALTVGDNSRWQIETDDLTEIDVVKVRLGANVKIKVDALPDQEFDGKVVHITPQAETKAGDQTYTVLIDLTSGDSAKLRWGMTTNVEIEIGPEL
jgi:multidrug resistance efflux pump